MKEELNKLLACPDCQKRFKLEVFVQESDEIISGVLQCKGCGQWFPISNAVPRIVSSDIYDRSNFISEFEEHLGNLDVPITEHLADHKSTVAAFDKEWAHYQEFGYDTRQYDFARKTGVKKGQINGDLVLDVGCGNGRFSVAAKEFGAAQVVSIDLISSIDKTYHRVKDKGISCVQADILNLPFREKTFDFIFSIGVLHHTQDTKQAFLQLPPLLKKKGRISATFYKKLTVVRELTDTVIRFFTTRMPKAVVWYLSYIPALLAKILHVVPVWKKEERWVRLDEVVFNTIVHIRPDHVTCYDWWSPKIATRHTWDEVKEWFVQAELNKITRVDYGAVAYTAIR